MLYFPLQLASFSQPEAGGEGGGATGLAIGLKVTGVGGTGLEVAGGDPQLASQAAGHAVPAVTPSLFSKKQRFSGFSAT